MIIKINGDGSNKVEEEFELKIAIRNVIVNWVIVDITDPDNPVQVESSTLSGSPVMNIQKEFAPATNMWLDFDVNPVNLSEQVLGISNENIGGGRFRVDITDVPTDRAVWLAVTTN